MSTAAIATVIRIPSPSETKNRRSSWPPIRRMCHATRRMSGVARTGNGTCGTGTLGIAGDRATSASRSRLLAAPSGPQPAVVSGASGTVTSATVASSAATRSAGSRWRLTPCAPPPMATRSRPAAEASRMTGQARDAPNGVIAPRS